MVLAVEVSAQFPRTRFGGSPVKREGAGRGVVAASALPYSRGTSVRKGWRKSMWGRFGQRRRSKRGPAVERATNALQTVWGRFGEGRRERENRKGSGNARKKRQTSGESGKKVLTHPLMTLNLTTRSNIHVNY